MHVDVAQAGIQVFVFDGRYLSISRRNLTIYAMFLGHEVFKSAGKWMAAEYSSTRGYVPPHAPGVVMVKRAL